MCNTTYNINDIVSSSVTILLTLCHKQTKEDEERNEENRGIDNGKYFDSYNCQCLFFSRCCHAGCI